MTPQCKVGKILRLKYYLKKYSTHLHRQFALRNPKFRPFYWNFEPTHTNVQ